MFKANDVLFDFEKMKNVLPLLSSFNERDLMSINWTLINVEKVQTCFNATRKRQFRH